jgi:hypothetical protein
MFSYGSFFFRQFFENIVNKTARPDNIVCGATSENKQTNRTSSEQTREQAVTRTCEAPQLLSAGTKDKQEGEGRREEERAAKGSTPVRAGRARSSVERTEETSRKKRKVKVNKPFISLNLCQTKILILISQQLKTIQTKYNKRQCYCAG